MHARPTGARTGGSDVLPDAEQYVAQVASFRDTMEEYSARLRGALGAIKRGLTPDVAGAQRALRAAGADEERALPGVPVMPALPHGAGWRLEGQTPRQPPAVAAAAPGQQGGGLAHGSGALTTQTNTQQRQQQVGTAAVASALPSGLARDPELDAPEVDAALSMYRRLFPEAAEQLPAGNGAGAPPLSGSPSALGGRDLLSKPVLGSPVLGSPAMTSRAAAPAAAAGGGGCDRDSSDRDSDRDEAICGGGSDGEAPSDAVQHMDTFSSSPSSHTPSVTQPVIVAAAGGAAAGGLRSAASAHLRARLMPAAAGPRLGSPQGSPSHATATSAVVGGTLISSPSKRLAAGTTLAHAVAGGDDGGGDGSGRRGVPASPAAARP
eukprot:17452-Chlamydomonas_euryale.AAC.1